MEFWQGGARRFYWYGLLDGLEVTIGFLFRWVSMFLYTLVMLNLLIAVFGAAAWAWHDLDEMRIVLQSMTQEEARANLLALFKLAMSLSLLVVAVRFVVFPFGRSSSNDEVVVKLSGPLSNEPETAGTGKLGESKDSRGK